MNKFTSSRRMPLGLLAVAWLAVAAATSANAQTSLQVQLSLRPLSSDDIATYKLPSTTQRSGGLSTVALGEPGYLEAVVSSTVAASDIASVTFALTKKPADSSADFEDSPLGPDVPLWEPADRLVLRLAGRKMLRPDVVGQYTVTATITTAKGDTATATSNITAATYVGIKQCSICHSVGADQLNKFGSWSQTAHAHIFKDGVNGVASPSYGSACFPCHTVGYDPNTTAANGGFDKVAAALKWTIPAVLKDGNWDAVPDALKNVANIQCENCHGPGSQHVSQGGNPDMISVSIASGDCGQCHGAMTHHVKTAEWNNSMHAVTTRDPTGAGREGCVGCHTAGGFIDRMKGAKITNTDYSAISCQACHEPHGQTTPSTNAHLVRNLDSVALQDGTVVTNAGAGTLCMNCHQSRRNAAVYAATQAASATFGPHHGPQADMLEGVNGFTYGKVIPSSAHGAVVEDTCVACHMQTVGSTDPNLSFVGGHTFKLSWKGNATLGAVELVGACQTCHGPDIATFDFPLLDYNGDGAIEGVQTEVQRLLDQLSALLPPAGKPKTSLTIDATWTRPQLEAAYNWQFVHDDGSHGIHNMAYAVGLLKASIADLSKK